MAVRIKHRRDTATNWAVGNPILAAGEKGYETDTKKWKSGDGTTAWNSLIYDIHISDVATPTISAVLDAGNIATELLDMNGNAIKNVPIPVESGDAANKSYVDQKTTNLRKLIGPIDCSANPDYPAGNVGDTYEVTVAGKIGGVDGIDVLAWDEIVCSQANGGGEQGDVGAYWYIVQGDVLEATEAVSGTIRIATTEEVEAEIDNAAVTPKRLGEWLTNILTPLFQTLTGKNANDGYVGLSGFMMMFKNAADTFTSFFSNSNTAARTYGFPDKSGTVALLDDIPAIINNLTSGGATSSLSAQQGVALKALIDAITVLRRKIDGSLHVEVAGTATTAEEIYWTYLIPANTLVNGDSIDIDSVLSFQSTSGSGKNFYLRVNNSASLAGAPIVANLASTNSSNTEIPLKIVQKIKCKAKTGQTLESAYLTSGAGTSGILLTVASLNFSLGSDIYLILSGKKALSGDTMTLRYAEVSINKQ